jgi:hypothetical protein
VSRYVNTINFQQYYQSFQQQQPQGNSSAPYNPAQQNVNNSSGYNAAQQNVNNSSGYNAAQQQANNSSAPYNAAQQQANNTSGYTAKQQNVNNSTQPDYNAAQQQANNSSAPYNAVQQQANNSSAPYNPAQQQNFNTNQPSGTTWYNKQQPVNNSTDGNPAQQQNFNSQGFIISQQNLNNPILPIVTPAQQVPASDQGAQAPLYNASIICQGTLKSAQTFAVNINNIGKLTTTGGTFQGAGTGGKTQTATGYLNAPYTSINMQQGILDSQSSTLT